MENTEIREFKKPRCIERKINEINADDQRVSIIGTIVDKKDKMLILDDGSDSINVFFDSSIPDFKLVRIIGELVSLGDKFEINAEIIQDMSDLDLKLYKNVHELEKEISELNV